jgi:hypothetical protein
MCLPVSRLFWVSSLAYPNLLGTKGYVVLVVVVVWKQSSLLEQAYGWQSAWDMKASAICTARDL